MLEEEPAVALSQVINCSMVKVSGRALPPAAAEEVAGAASSTGEAVAEGAAATELAAGAELATGVAVLEGAALEAGLAVGVEGALPEPAPVQTLGPGMG